MLYYYTLIIKKIKTYIEYNKSYQTILKEWKIIRKQNENKNNS
jgi:hypothetical protein